jgi:hypothetical protein
MKRRITEHSQTASCNMGIYIHIYIYIYALRSYEKEYEAPRAEVVLLLFLIGSPDFEHSPETGCRPWTRQRATRVIAGRTLKNNNKRYT